MDMKALRQKILDLAIRGKLVPQDPNDEPAYVLLERIRQQKQQMVKEGKLKPKDIKNDSVIFVGEDNLHYEKFADGSVKCIEDEIPFDLPEGWEWERLSNLASFSGGKTPSTSRSEYWDGDILWVTSKDMKSKYITSSQLRLSALGAEQMQMYQPDTLLLVTRSGILRHTLPVAILKECATINQDLKAIILYMPQLAEYIYVCLKGMETQLLLKYTKSGTTVENVNFDEFQKVLLPIPPIQQIDRIMSSTGSAESVVSTIEDNKAALADYVVKAKSKILDLAIRGQLVPQDPNDEPASVLLERIRAEKEELIKQGKIKRDKKESFIFRGEDNSYYEKMGAEVRCIDSELPFDLPDSWTFARLKHISEIVGGGTPKTNIAEYWDGNIPWLTPADFSGYEKMYISAGARTITELGLKSSSAQMLPKNSVLYSSRAPIGYIAIAATPVATNQGFKSVVPYDLAMSPYLFYCLKAITDDIIQRATGTTFKEISGSEMAETIIPLPPIHEQQRIFKKATRLFEVITTIEKSLS